MNQALRGALLFGSMLFGLLAAQLAGPGLHGSPASADAPVRMRLVGRAVAADLSTARFTIRNTTPEPITVLLHDGDSVYNGLERMEADGSWTDLVQGGCGSSPALPVTIAPGARRTVTANVGTAAGTYRVYVGMMLSDERATSREDSIVSAPFTHR